MGEKNIQKDCYCIINKEMRVDGLKRKLCGDLAICCDKQKPKGISSSTGFIPLLKTASTVDPNRGAWIDYVIGHLRVKQLETFFFFVRSKVYGVCIMSSAPLVQLLLRIFFFNFFYWRSDLFDGGLGYGGGSRSLIHPPHPLLTEGAGLFDESGCAKA